MGDNDYYEVVQYYDRLAERYDQERFGNSYGAYVDAQERRILNLWLAPLENGSILDLGCGTGRLLDLATHGLDASEEMVKLARSKHPHKPIHCGPGIELEKMGVKFDAIFCLHLFMHLPHDQIRMLLQACQKQLQPRGLFIFDVPNALRRRLTGFRAAGWHAGTALSGAELRDLAGAGWKQRAQRGVLLFPIHRVPSQLRSPLRHIDDFLCMTPLSAISSYSLHCLEKT